MGVLVDDEVVTATCTPCGLGIHSCCTSRLFECQCTDDGHGRRAGPGSSPPAP